MNSYCFFIAASWGDGVIPKHCQSLARHLVARGHRVVYLPHGQKITLQEGNFYVYSFPSPRPTHFRDFIFLHRLVRQYKPDCMIANFGAVNVMTVVGWLSRVPCRIAWYHTPLSASKLDDQSLGIIAQLKVLRKAPIYKALTCVVGNSDFACHDVSRAFHVPVHKTKTFFNSIADPLLNGILDTPAKDRHMLVCVGRLDPVKGQDILIRALALLKDELHHVRIELIGHGRMETEYRELAATLGLKDDVIFRGSVSHDEVLRSMRASTITLVPSRSEAFGLVNIESMAVGTPVIASAVGGIPEIVRDGIDGFLVLPEDPQAFADKIKFLLENDDICEEMGRNARQRFLDVFEQEKNIERQAEWFEQLVTNGRV